MSRSAAFALIAGLAACVVTACVPRPTSEDKRRADALRSDALFARTSEGFADQTVHVYVGHGGGPANAWSEVEKNAALSGSAREAIRASVEDAVATGWTIQTVDCHPGTSTEAPSYLVRGVKQMNGFVALLLIENYSSDVPRVLIRASTPSTEQSPSPTIGPNQTSSTVVGSTGTCLDA